MKNIRFNLTKEMYDLIIEIIIINQILNQKLNKYEKDTLFNSDTRNCSGNHLL